MHPARGPDSSNAMPYGNPLGDGFAHECGRLDFGMRDGVTGPTAVGLT